MDWFRVDVREVLNTGLNTKEIGRLIQYKALIALKERIPTDTEIGKVMRVNSLKKLDEKLVEQQEKLHSMANEVLFFVEEVKSKREYERKKKRKQRDDLKSNKLNVPGDVPKEETGTSRGYKSRVHEIREKKEKDKKENFSLSLSSSPNSQPNYHPRNYDPTTFTEGMSYSERTFNCLWTGWQDTLRGNRFNAKETFDCELIPMEGCEINNSLFRILECFQEYCACDAVKEGKIMKLPKWLGEYENWVPKPYKFKSLDDALGVMESRIRKDETK